MVDANTPPLRQPDGKLNPDWIEAHNARVEAFWAGIDPLVKAMTDGQCREAVRLGHDEWLSMNQIAERMKAGIGGGWADEYDPAVGAAIFQEALERLDVYDADFRPRPERQPMGKVEGADVFYLTAEGEYEVLAGGRSERFRALHRPKFGMDVDDVARAARIAKALTGTAAE